VSGELGNSRRYVEQQYADDSNLAARQSIYAYQQPRLDLGNGAIELADLDGDESVLDIGCGNGRYLATLRERGHRGYLVGADLSVGMLRTARPAMGDGPLLVSDAQALPFATGSFDAVLAMHMMYHVPDRARALGEIRRVVRPGGVVLLFTNAESHFRELDELLIACAADTVGASRVRSRSSLTLFSVESATPEIEAVFDEVRPYAFGSRLVVDEVAPVITYARSMGAFVTDSHGALDAVLVELERRVAEIIATSGAFRITTTCGLFVCR
jgi:SAM-dependent methyltransferase